MSVRIIQIDGPCKFSTLCHSMYSLYRSIYESYWHHRLAALLWGNMLAHNNAPRARPSTTTTSTLTYTRDTHRHHLEFLLPSMLIIIPAAQWSCWGGGGGYTGFTPSVRPSVRLSVRPSRMPCPLCNIYSYECILFILGTNDHYHERVCRTPWPLTLTFIFKVIWPWLRKSCPLCSVYSSWWILFIFGTNDHYH